MTTAIISSNGLRPVCSIRLQKGVRYFMGASTSPREVVVVRFDGRTVTTMDVYSREEAVTHRAAAEHLLATGCQTAMAKFGTNFPGETVRLLALLEGEDVEPEDLRDWDRVRITVRSTDGSDRWRDAEEFGSVVGLEVDGVEHLEIVGFRKDVEGVLSDNRFVVVSV